MADERGVTKYYLILGTNHPLGLEKMKESMWKASPSQDYSFSAKDEGRLFFASPGLDSLKDDIFAAFKGKTVPVEEIESYVLSETLFLKSHLRSRALIPLEDEGRINVTGRQRKRSYPCNGAIIQFNK